MSETQTNATASSSETPLFLRAASGEYTERAPIWLMRQAGRYLPEYRALKEKYTFWELCRTPELAAEVTFQPLRRFAFDAAILFSDIMTPLSFMGADIEFAPGPIIKDPVRSEGDVANLRIPEAEEIAPFVPQIIKILRSELKVPLIGFGGAPLTLATYLVEGKGSKDYPLFRQFLRSHPEAAHQLLEKLTQTTIKYLTTQIEAGAQAIQLFDSWAGLHNEDMYQTFGVPYIRRILDALEPYGVPRIYIAVGAGHLYPLMGQFPVEVISADWRIPLDRVRPFVGNKTLQGNLDPAILLASPDVVKAEAEKILRSGLGGPHIFNLGHGIFPQAKIDNVATLVETVHSFERTRPA